MGNAGIAHYFVEFLISSQNVRSEIKMWRKKFLGLSLILLILLTGCQLGDKKEVADTVRLYNDKLLLALKRPEPELMKQLTNDREYERITMYILYLYQNKAVVNSKLNSLEIVSAKVNGKKATVKTREQWVYKRVDPETRKTINSSKKVIYEGSYSLEKNKQGKWVVSGLTVKEQGTEN